jgi:microcystin-dependent protein
VPIHEGNGPGLSPRQQGSRGGAESVTLVANQIPSHTHELQVTNEEADQTSPAGNILAASSDDIYYQDSPNDNARSDVLLNTGGSQSHPNMQPSLVINFCIALFGVYPSRS